MQRDSVADIDRLADSCVCGCVDEQWAFGGSDCGTALDRLGHVHRPVYGVIVEPRVK